MTNRALVCGLSVASTTVTPLTLTPGQNGSLMIAASVNITVPANTMGACAWISSIPLTTSCGNRVSSLMGQFRANIL